MKRSLQWIFLLVTASAFAHAPEPKFVCPSGTLTAAGTANTLAQNVMVNEVGADLYTDDTFATTNGLTLADGNNELRFKATDAFSQSVTITQVFNLPASVYYDYDLNGNLTSDGAREYEYDDADRLVRITAADLWKSEFVYDAFGRRIVRKEFVWQNSAWSQAEEVRYVWLGMSVLQERDAANQVRVTYTGRLAREDANSTSFYFADGNGNISSLIDSGGNVKAKYRYDSFGNLLSKSGALADANLIRFSGKEYHANSGLYYYGFRYYAPNLQRWMNQDPIGIAGGLNLYGFVGNDPINQRDADGRFFGFYYSALSDAYEGFAERTSSPTLGYIASVVGDVTGFIAGLDQMYGGIQDMRTLREAGLEGLLAQKYKGLEEGVGTADLVRAVDYADEYSALEQGIYGASGLAKSAFCILGARGAVGKKGKGPTETPDAPQPKVGSAKPACLPAPAGTLTAAEWAEIQAIANKYNTTIDVVGSRAAGTGRNIQTSLPVGKKANLRSDIDFRIDASHPQVSDLIKDLKAVGGGAGSASTKFSTTTRATTPPFIRFEPNL